jgi:hypothetical protein
MKRMKNMRLDMNTVRMLCVHVCVEVTFTESHRKWHGIMNSYPDPSLSSTPRTFHPILISHPTQSMNQ